MNLLLLGFWIGGMSATAAQLWYEWNRGAGDWFRLMARVYPLRCFGALVFCVLGWPLMFAHVLQADASGDDGDDDDDDDDDDEGGPRLMISRQPKTDAANGLG
jgi:hypothetical protein